MLARKSFSPALLSQWFVTSVWLRGLPETPSVFQGKVDQKSNPTSPTTLWVCSLCALFYCFCQTAS